MQASERCNILQQKRDPNILHPQESNENGPQKNFILYVLLENQKFLHPRHILTILVFVKKFLVYVETQDSCEQSLSASAWDIFLFLFCSTQVLWWNPIEPFSSTCFIFIFPGAKWSVLLFP
jgi:hypothetical protein